VVSIAVLQLVPDPAAALAEMARVLRAGGRLAVPTAGWAAGIWRMLPNIGAHVFGEDEIGDILEDHGVHQRADQQLRHSPVGPRQTRVTHPGPRYLGNHFRAPRMRRRVGGVERAMIHLMQMRYFTGNPPYSIPSYSCPFRSGGGGAAARGSVGSFPRYANSSCDPVPLGRHELTDSQQAPGCDSQYGVFPGNR
jgi:SAM-dependent methyltransferase